MVAEKVCLKCGTRVDVGLIFCKKCGATLQSPVPLVPPLTPEVNRAGMSAKAIVLIFVLCAVADFVLGYIHERSFPAGLISVIGGLFGTAFYVLVFKWFLNGSDQTDSSR